MKFDKYKPDNEYFTQDNTFQNQRIFPIKKIIKHKLNSEKKLIKYCLDKIRTAII